MTPETVDDLIRRVEAANGSAALEAKTTEIAKQHGCDRAVFTVCWAEVEDGAVCRCKADAALLRATRSTDA